MHMDIKRVVDIELTNRCNATCSFCPREKTPKQGFMDYPVFLQAVARVKEFGPQTDVFLTGLGEPMLHPRFVDCIRHLHDEGLRPAVTTNASRLFRDKSVEMLDAGLKWIDFSVSDLGEDYRNVYHLDFEVTRKNIADFMEVNQGRAAIQVTVVRHDGNSDKIDAMEQYWKSAGIPDVRIVREINRGGSCSRKYHFQGSHKYRQEARDALKNAGLTEVCGSPFGSIFIGWNGNYYLCCMDWEKTAPMGHVSTLSIGEVDELKMRYLHKPSALCSACSVNPVNDLCEILHEVELGQRGKFALANRINNYRKSGVDRFTAAVSHWQQSHPDLIASDAPVALLSSSGSA